VAPRVQGSRHADHATNSYARAACLPDLSPGASDTKEEPKMSNTLMFKLSQFVATVKARLAED
jgi:hypothetical protein